MPVDCFCIVDALYIVVVKIWKILTKLVYLRYTRQYSLIINDLYQLMRKKSIRKRQQSQLMTHLCQFLKRLLMINQLHVKNHLYHNMIPWQNFSNAVITTRLLHLVNKLFFIFFNLVADLGQNLFPLMDFDSLHHLEYQIIGP